MDAGAVVRLLADSLRGVHGVASADCPFVTTNATLAGEARRRVAAGLVDPAAFDRPFTRHGPEDLLRLVEASPLADEDDRGAVIHGDARLAAFHPRSGGALAAVSRLGRLGLGDPYRDLAVLASDLAAGGAPPEVLGQLFAAYGIDRVDVVRVDWHVLVDQLLR